MSMNLTLLKKIRCRFLDRTTGMPVPGVIASLSAAVGDETKSAQLPVATLCTDAMGYMSFDLKPIEQLTASGFFISAPKFGLKNYDLLGSLVAATGDGAENEDEYLFSWKEVPGKDSVRLLEFLNQEFDISWVFENATIEKIDNDRKIRVTAEDNVLSLRLNNEKTKVNVKIDDPDGRSAECIAKSENCKLNIYKDVDADGSKASSIAGEMMENFAKDLECIVFPIYLENCLRDKQGSESAPCKPTRFPSIQSPDVCDYKVSPFSFVTPTALKLGNDSCEILLPSSLPIQQFRFYKVIVQQEEKVIDKDKVPREVKLFDDLESLVRNPVIKFGEILEYQQEWYSLGHSLGEIKYSLPLAPGESTQLAVIDWSRDDLASRTDKISATEFLDHDLRRDRAIEETVEAALREEQGGSSHEFGTSGAVTSPGEFVTTSGNHSFGVAISNSYGKRDLSGESLQDLHDRVRQASSSVRSLNSTVIVQGSQAEKSTLQTRRVANHNHCHALTIQYYEVLRHYRMSTKFSGRRQAVLIPFAPFSFDWEIALRFRTVLEQTLLDPLLINCFDALIRLNLAPSVYDAPKPVSSAETAGEAAETTDYRELLITTVEGMSKRSNVKVRINDKIKITASGLLAMSFGTGHGSGGVPPDGDGKIYGRGGDYPMLDGDLIGYSLIYKLRPTDPWLQGSSSFDLTANVNGEIIFGVNTQSNGFVDFGNRAAPFWRVALEFPLHETDTPTPIDPSKDDASKDLPFRKSDDELCSARLLTHLQANQGFYNGAVWMLRDAVERRLYLGDALSDRPDIFEGMDDRPIAISGNYVAFGYMHKKSVYFFSWEEVPGNDNLRLVEFLRQEFDISWVENAKIEKIDQGRTINVFAGENFLSLELNNEKTKVNLKIHGVGSVDCVAKSENGKLNIYKSVDEVEDILTAEDIVTLPTRGLFAEAQMGHCNSCEKRDVTRMWDWTEMTAETPPEISGISPGPKGVAPSITPMQLPGNVIQITQPQNAPDPTGLANALSVLKTPDIFRDMSGLDELSKLLGELAKASGDANSKALALKAKEKVDGMKGSGGGAGAVNPSASQTPEERYDNLQVAKEVAKASQELGWDDTRIGDVTSDIVSGGGGGFYSTIRDIVEDAIKGTKPATMPTEHKTLAEKAKFIGDQPMLVKAYEMFQKKTWGWWFSPNGTLAGKVSKPANLKSWSDWDSFDWRQKAALADVAEVNANSLGRNATNLSKLETALKQWPDDYYAVFQSGSTSDTNTCNLFLGDALTLDGRAQVQANGKYYSAQQVHQGEGGFREVPLFYVVIGDVACWGEHVEIVTEVNYSEGTFCSRGGWRTPPGSELCEEQAKTGRRKLDYPGLRFMRVA